MKKSIFAICIWEKLFVASPYHNDRAQKLDSQNRIPVLRKFSIFAEKYILQFFSKGKQPQNLLCRAYFFFEQVEIFSGKQTFDITCPMGKSYKS